jgi:four helix bundle protein
MKNKKDILLEKSFSFALRVVKLYQYLTTVKKEFVMSKQLLKSGTSVGSNVRESKNAESGLDFIHKLAVSQKECDESMYWLELLNAAEYINGQEFTSMHKDADELLKIIKSSILTKKQNLKKK